MTKPIPAGYALTIVSWENDADCYKRQVFNGLTKVDVQFLLALATQYKSMSRPGGGLGGGSWHWDGGIESYSIAVADGYDKVIEKFSTLGVSHELFEQFNTPTAERPSLDPDSLEFPDELFDLYSDSISELVGYPEDEMYQTDGYIRVFDDFTVHLYEAPVKDVTKEFK